MRIASLLLLPLAAGLCVAQPTAIPYRWDGVAIGGGGLITGIAFHPQPGEGLYTRTDVGGAYRWNDGAKRWEAVTDWLGWRDSNLMGIESIALDPGDPSRVLLAAGTYNHPAFGHGAILAST